MNEWKNEWLNGQLWADIPYWLLRSSMLTSLSWKGTFNQVPLLEYLTLSVSSACLVHHILLIWPPSLSLSKQWAGASPFAPVLPRDISPSRPCKWRRVSLDNFSLHFSYNKLWNLKERTPSLGSCSPPEQELLGQKLTNSESLQNQGLCLFQGLDCSSWVPMGEPVLAFPID